MTPLQPQTQLTRCILLCVHGGGRGGGGGGGGEEESAAIDSCVHGGVVLQWLVRKLCHLRACDAPLVLPVHQGTDCHAQLPLSISLHVCNIPSYQL